MILGKIEHVVSFLHDIPSNRYPLKCLRLGAYLTSSFTRDITKSSGEHGLRPSSKSEISIWCLSASLYITNAARNAYTYYMTSEWCIYTFVEAYEEVRLLSCCVLWLVLVNT